MHITRWIRSLAVLALVLSALSAASFGQLVLSVSFGPPALPVYEQPPCPTPGYMWTPGYWAYGPQGYFWVPGTWVGAPAPGLLWTPGYWGWGNGAYGWHEGYWGPHVGFYGGVVYGYGYTGGGYEGGYWNHGAYYYNRSVTNVSTTNVTNVYNKTVINNVTVNNVSYNGGAGGVNASPTAEQAAAANERHVAPTPLQTQHVNEAVKNPDFLASVNHGKPGVAATTKPGVFKGPGVVAAKAAAPYHPPANPVNTAAANREVPRLENTVARPAIESHNVAPHPAVSAPAPVIKRAAAPPPPQPRPAAVHAAPVPEPKKKP